MRYRKDRAKQSRNDIHEIYASTAYILSSVLLALPAYAQLHQEEKSNAPNSSSIAIENIDNKDNAYASAIIGNGVIHGKGVSDEQSMQWRAFEIRFGKEIGNAILSNDNNFLHDDKLRVDFVHYNEGHPTNNHRDGFAVQMVYQKQLNQKLNAEVGLGPYFNMNTTVRDGLEYNDYGLGVLLSLTTLIKLESLSAGTHIRVALNHVTVPGAHSSNALLIGMGKYFDDVPSPIANDWSNHSVWLSALAISSETNRSDTTDHATGFSLEAKKYYGHGALSIAAILEGDDKSQVDRKGIGLQGWFVQPISENWALSAGIGPYAAANQRDSGDIKLHGLFSVQIERSISKSWKIFGRFSRVTTFQNKNDRDLREIGIMKEIGR